MAFSKGEVNNINAHEERGRLHCTLMATGQEQMYYMIHLPLALRKGSWLCVEPGHSTAGSKVDFRVQMKWAFNPYHLTVQHNCVVFQSHIEGLWIDYILYPKHASNCSLYL